MKYILQVLVFLSISFATVSCKKYLDLKPDKKLTVPSSLKDLQALLDNNVIMNAKSATYDITSADDHFIPFSIYASMSLNQRKAYIWENFEYNYSNDWALLYDRIYYANVVLKEVERIKRNTLNAPQWDNTKGSALVYRASSLLKAAWIFSKAYDTEESDHDYGIVLRTDPEFDQVLKRSSVSETYSKIIEDLMASIPLLPEKPLHVMRPSKQAAYGLLARTYLSMRSYDSAFKYSNLCLSIDEKLLDYNSINSTSVFTFRPFPNKEIVFHLQADLGFYFTGVNVRVDSLLYQSYHDNDIRKKAFFRQQANGYQFKGTYVGNFGSPFTGIATDEMFLTRAECYARHGYVDKAMEDLNRLLSHRFITGSFTNLQASTKEEALHLVLTERRKELLFRGLRWMDIKRLNKEGANIILKRSINGVAYTLQPNENRYALPLPSDIISLTGIAQNPL